MPSSSELPLSRLRVVDLSDRLAGAYCTKLLVDAGAEVVKVEPPAGDPLRYRRSTVPGSSARPGAMFDYLCASKRSVVIDLDTRDGNDELQQLLRGADLVVETWVPGVAERRGLSAAELHEINPALTMISISAFGRGGPRSQEDLPEFLLQAISGAIYSRGRPGRDPLYAAGELSEWMAGAVAAAAGLASFYGYADASAGNHIDISILEAAASSLVTAPVIAESLRGYPFRVSALRSVPGIERCSDGWVGLFMLTAQQWFDFTVMIERPELAVDTKLASLLERQNRGAELVPLIEAWTTQHTVEEVLGIAELLRIPAAPVGNGQSLPGFEAIARRGIYVDNPRGFRQPRSMFRFGDIPHRPIEAAPELGALDDPPIAWTSPPRASARTDTARTDTTWAAPTGERPLEGVRVLDLTAFWAGPFATGILSGLGAEVIKIESVQHPDPLRFTGLMPPTEKLWFEAAPLFNVLNLDKQSLTLDLGSEEGRGILMQLVQTADVVVENFTPRVLDNFKLGYEQFAAVRPDIILARMPAFGLDGPWRDRPGFAPTIEQMSGLAWITGWEDTEPIAPNGFVDPIAGAHLAFAIVSALVSRRRTGRGLQLELPMVEVATTITAEQVIEFDMSGQLQSRHGNSAFRTTPQGVYDCSGEGDTNWIAISVQNDDQWATLAEIVDAQVWGEATLDQLVSADSRWEHRQAIDDRLRTWCAAFTVDEIAKILDVAGVPAAPVVHDHLIVNDVQMSARGYWEEVPHPVIGTQWYAGLPFWQNGRRWYARASPLLGQDNEVILGDLGFTAEQQHDLEQRSVIGRVPLGL